MNASTVNEISKIFLALPKADMFVILCVQVTPTKHYKPLAWKGAGAWIGIDPNEQAEITPNELFAEASVHDIVMADRPVAVKGFTYIMLIRCECTIKQHERTALLNGIIEAHDRNVNVAPNKDVLALLDLAGAVDQIGFHYTINFKDRRYKLVAIRYGQGEEIDEDLMVDPLSFDAALYVKGWAMADAPTHTNRTSTYRDENSIPTLVKDIYYALIVRATTHTGPTYLLSSATDLQDWRRREQGITAHMFRTNAATAVAAD